MGTERTYNFKPVEDLVFTDDFMFGAVMREPEICKGILERLLHTGIDHIEYPASLAETHGWQTDSRPVRGASRNVRVSERVEDIGKRGSGPATTRA
ncbi:MAG: hypothetical protein II837_01940 [Treponema sp.]|nr:hypothetical protein [Treponema sp.]